MLSKYLGKLSQSELKNGWVGPVVEQPIGGRGGGNVRWQGATSNVASAIKAIWQSEREENESILSV